MMNVPTIIVALLIAASFVGIIASAVQSKRNGKSILCSCGGSCSCDGTCGCSGCNCASDNKQ